MKAPTRLAVVRWLRRTHRWFGLWGATFGLLVGFSGIWLNHRAVLKLPFAQEIRNSLIAAGRSAGAGRMAAQLVGVDAPPTSVRVEKARPVP